MSTNVTTKVLEVDPERPAGGAIGEAARALRDGKLVAFPTETVYGLGARALDGAHVARVFAAKGRPKGNPLIVHVLGEEEARALAAEWSPAAAKLAQAFWPGPLSIVVPRGDRIPREVTGGGGTVALRAPRGGVVRALLQSLGEPLAAPSANRYQTLSPTTAMHVLATLDGKVDLLLDGGPCAQGIESTVVDVSGKAPRLLRPGALGLAALRACIPDLVVERAEAAPGAKRPSPGMDARHYAPRARLRLVAGRPAAIAAAYAEPAGTRVGVVLRGAPGAQVLKGGDVHALYLPDDPAAYAKEMFATLHALDAAGATTIVVEAPPQDDAWAAVADRLRRGAAR